MNQIIVSLLATTTNYAFDSNNPVEIITMTASPDSGHGTTSLAARSQLQRSQTRQELEDSITHHLRCIINIKTQLNSLLPISVLPTEVLAEVFLFRAASCRQTNHHVPIMSGWIALSHVCKHWRTVALGCPSLWNRLVIARHAEWVPELLSRSKELPLSIYMWLHGLPQSSDSLTSPTPDDPTELVLSSLGRIRILHISLMTRGSTGRGMRLLDGPAPLLESLTVSDLLGTLSPHKYVDGLLQRPESSGLRRLDLTLSQTTWPVFFPRNLTHLTIRSFGRHSGGDASFQQLFSSLARMPLLEVFKATGTFEPDGASSLLCPLRPPISLPHLRSMSLLDMQSFTVVHITRSLYTPSLSHLCISSLYPPVSLSLDLLAAIAEKTAMLPPLVSLAIMNEHWPSNGSTIRAYADVCDAAKGTIDNSVMSWMDTHAPLLEISTVDLFSHRPTLTIFCALVKDISSLILEHALPPQERWLCFAQCIPSVTDVYILNADPIDALPAMLSTSEFPENQPQVDGLVPNYVFSRLHTLTLEAAQFPPMYPSPPQRRRRSHREARTQVGFLEPLVSCFAARRQGGAGVERLRILHPNEMSQMALDQLSQVVPSVKWDGVSGASALDAYRRDTDPMNWIYKTHPDEDDEETDSDSVHSEEDGVDDSSWY